MESLRVSNLLKVSVNEYDDMLVLDCDDISVFEKFSYSYDMIQKISDAADQEIAGLKKKYKDSSASSTDEVRSYIAVNMECAKKVMDELNTVFGNDFTNKVFRENYELNPDFVPTMIALTELIEALLPIMEEAYGERIKRNKSKYNSSKRGKHTKTKEELIAEYAKNRDDE